MRKFENWTVAYRRRSGDATLLDDRDAPFTVIPNTWRYWCADPHLIEEDGTAYVFAEMYDRVLRRGVIGYCTLGDAGASPWKVILKAPYHLSYPHLFKQNGRIRMIPESYVANEIAVYEASSFPDRWEKHAVLQPDYCAVDSTLFNWDGTDYLLTLRFDGDDEKLMLYPAENGKPTGAGFCAAVNDANKRPAGHFFTAGGTRIRPAQDCTDSYGCALNFYRIRTVSASAYAEELIAKIRPEELHSNLKKPAEGIHTYNCSKHYEVIDLKGYETDPLFYITRPIWFLWRRIKRIFAR